MTNAQHASMKIIVRRLFTDKTQTQLVKMTTKHQQMTHSGFTATTQLLTKT